MPAATWRRWYPHDIEKWNSSPAIQMLSDAAYRAYHSLIMAQWESEDGYLPENDRLLQTLARVREESRWSEIRNEILALFVTENGRVFSRKQRGEWLRAKTVSERKGKRSPESGLSQDGKKPVSGHNNNNNNSIKKLKNSSRDKREVDPRFSEFKKACESYYSFKHFEMTWDASEAKQLSQLLSANPTLTLEQFQGILRNRSRSQVVHSERPRKWLSNATDYAAGPIDRFNKPQGAGGANGSTTGAGRTMEAARQYLETLRDNEDPGGTGYPENGGDQQGNVRRLC